MLVRLNDSLSAIFTPWKAFQGCVFDGPVALDTETDRIDEARPWLVPPLVLAAAADGRRGVFLTRETLPGFLRAHPDAELVLHNAAFDLAVVHRLDPALAIYDRVDADRVWDTRLLHRLLVLGIEGHAARRKGESTLETCCRTYLGVNLPKDVRDAEGDEVRLSYGKFLNRPPSGIPPAYLDYLGKDALATFGVFRELLALHERLRRDAGGFGYVSPDWLDEQARRWGPQTHHVQLKASVVLDEIGRNGLRIDMSRRDELDAELAASEKRLLEELRRFGYLPGKGSAAALQSILKRAERECGSSLPRTERSGAIATSAEALEEIGDRVPFVAAFLEYKTVQKLRGGFLSKLSSETVHPSFEPLVETGRTSSFGAINSQNLPRDARVRRCFVARDGCDLVVADYAQVELRTLAQALTSQGGWPSRLAEQLNAGVDPHRRLAAAFTGKPESAVTAEERRRAKAVNFGKPGGLGDAALQGYAKGAYGLDLTDEDVRRITAAYFAEYPEMQAFLDGGDEAAGLTAAWLGLTPADHFERTGERRFVDHPDNGGEGETPHPLLGLMALKVYGREDPRTVEDRPYRPSDVEYFWGALARRAGSLPPSLAGEAIARRPSAKLRKGVLAVGDRTAVYTLTGRRRANATWTQRRNTPFQGLAADGAKLALWRVWRAGFRIVNFVHDEIVVETPETALPESAESAVARLMIEGMRAVVPDVRIEVAAVRGKSWAK